jgi:outer membrane protein OmpA-like peptidoglycan-associated protein
MMTRLQRTLPLALCLAALAAVGARGQDAAEGSTPAAAAAAADDSAPSSAAAAPGPSHDMKLAIHFYDIGDDMQAMDLFMEILTKGDPTERPTANEYLNLITKRMSSVGGAGGSPAAPKPTEKPAVVVEGAPGQPAAAPPPAETGPVPIAPARPGGARPEEMTPANKALMRKEISARLHAAADKSLADLREIDGVRVLSRGSGDPAAIGIPSSLLFQSGIAFLPDAAKILDPLTKLVFALGSTQVVILPEGTAIGDAKVLDMRRTMGISSHLYEEGVAPPRVRVNLLNTQVDIPRGMLDFKGVVLVFVYDQPMSLSVESAVGDELGPPISLGVFPPQLRPSRNQGAIVEFSVSEPPAGLASWKFQLLQPSTDGSELTPLQEVTGGGPVFHQIFWNARVNYFGAPLPAGRYECVLTATDAKNRQRALHRWINVLADGQGEEKLLAESVKAAAAASAPAPAPEAAASAAAPAAGAAAPAADLPGDGAKPLVADVAPAPDAAAAPPPPKKHRRKVASRAKAKKKAKASSDAPGHYKLEFDRNTHQLTEDAEKSLAKAANDLSSYPLETLKVVGHAAADEEDGSALADRRAKMVAGLLINRYQVEPKKLDISAGSTNDAAAVELIVVRSD